MRSKLTGDKYVVCIRYVFLLSESIKQSIAFVI